MGDPDRAPWFERVEAERRAEAAEWRERAEAAEAQRDRADAVVRDTLAKWAAAEARCAALETALRDVLPYASRQDRFAEAAYERARALLESPTGDGDDG